MCHEAWWRERRARTAEESREVWRDFERTRPADEPAGDDKPDVVRLKTEDDAVTADR